MCFDEYISSGFPSLYLSFIYTCNMPDVRRIHRCQENKFLTSEDTFI